ncbi:dihydrodipicolinate synthase family protein [Streptomyces sp. NPDC001273]|uniref:dihydrodipicolinate synthase family protein n=1 Tax=unclassified Streptomyces TaxID=2593676 RepID=UPI0033C1C871
MTNTISPVTDTGTQSPHAPGLTGVVPVLPTPFTPAGDIDTPSFDRILDHLIGLGVPGVMLPGFASEFYKLDEAEKVSQGRRAIARTSGTGTVSVLAVHGHATRHAIGEARRWIDLGADWINLLPPQYMSPQPDALADHCAAVLDAVSGTPVILQYAPTSGAGLSPDHIHRLTAEHRNLAAVKVEARPPYRFIDALQQAECPVPAFAGTGGLYLVESLRLGACGVQPGSGFVEIYQAILKAWTAGREQEADDLYARLLTYLVGWANSQESMVAIEKRIAHRRGLLDHPDCRAPHQTPHTVEDTAIERFLAEFHPYLRGTS